MKNIIILLIIAVIAFSLIAYGAEKSEINECKTWQKESSELKDYYLVGWQKEQCDFHGVEINAPVK